MEEYSIEDKGEICFNIYCYNVKPGITINYKDGSSSGPQTKTIKTDYCKYNRKKDNDIYKRTVVFFL